MVDGSGNLDVVGSELASFPIVVSTNNFKHKCGLKTLLCNERQREELKSCFVGCALSHTSFRSSSLFHLFFIFPVLFSFDAPFFHMFSLLSCNVRTMTEVILPDCGRRSKKRVCVQVRHVPRVCA